MPLPYPLLALAEIKATREPFLRLFCYSMLLEFLLDSLYPLPKESRSVRSNVRSLIGHNRDKFGSYQDVSFANDVRNKVAHPTRTTSTTRHEVERACQYFEKAISELLVHCPSQLTDAVLGVPAQPPPEGQCPVCYVVIEVVDVSVNSVVGCKNCGYEFRVVAVSPLAFTGPVRTEMEPT